MIGRHAALHEDDRPAAPHAHWQGFMGRAHDETWIYVPGSPVPWDITGPQSAVRRGPKEDMSWLTGAPCVSAH